MPGEHSMASNTLQITLILVPKGAFGDFGGKKLHRMEIPLLLPIWVLAVETF